ncbi:MAG TPA: 16S rRNA (guanine(527)-N(7))-methyltransferase RsmG [Xanthobacteraceae bacterium]|nr:16S rRNA (guanine(527)-N(7))-methyltransferase RsmG [Xanthobacteraceae bacterium]
MNAERLAADRAAALRIVLVSRETLERLDAFAPLFLKWQRAVQLVAPSTLPNLWTRHIADSLQLLDLAYDAKTWADLGTGGGFPGLVLAIARAKEPGWLMHLIESDTRKAAFLREAARVTGAAAKVHHERIESAAKRLGKIDVVTARALAPLPRLIDLAAPLLGQGAKGIFLKTQHVGEELTETTKSWTLNSTIVPSLTDSRGRIVVIESVSRRSDVGRSGEAAP